MTYPSKTPAARRAESKARRDRAKGLMMQVNERLAPMGLTHDALLRGIVDGTVEVKKKEKGKMIRRKKHTFTIRKDGDLSVWWIPQVPGKSFRVPVSSLQEASLIIDTLLAYDHFQFRYDVKGDYVNAGGLSAWEDGEWSDWYDEDNNSFDEWREKNGVKELVEFNQ